MKKYVRQYGFLLLLSGGVIVIDQCTKYLIREHLALGAEWLPDGLAWLSPWARFVHWYNTGAAFGMFQNGGVLFALLAVLVSGMIFYYYPQLEAEDWALRWALGLEMGGALGNMIDRLQFGSVTDFISVGTFPVFNIADSAISVGVVFLFLGWYLQEKRLRQESAAAAAEESVLEDE